jgi:hypothetical protein
LRNRWYPFNRRSRSRLRKRKNNPYWPGFYRFSEYYSGIANKNGSYDKNKILDSGFTVGETWGCLEKAWVGFRAAKRLENDEVMKLYASIIQRLEKELKIEVNDFPELGLCACNLEEANTEEEKDQDEEEDSKLAIIDPWTNEKVQEAKEDEDDYREVDFDSL